MAKVIVADDPTCTAAGENDLAMVGRARRVALATATLVTLRLLLNAPAGSVFV